MRIALPTPAKISSAIFRKFFTNDAQDPDLLHEIDAKFFQKWPEMMAEI
jgi:hypothetical protein